MTPKEKVQAAFLAPFLSGNRFMQVMASMGYTVTYMGPLLLNIRNSNGAAVYKYDPMESREQAFDQFWTGIKRATQVGLLKAYDRPVGIGKARFVPFPDSSASPASAA